MIELRSDTATTPSRAMREAMANAEVGDEQRREDPTVNELERRVAGLLGQEEAVYLPTATMANLIALRILTRPGQEVLAEESSHVFGAELAGPAVHSGLAMRAIQSENGRPVETNFVQIDVGADRASALTRLREQGVLLSTTIHPTIVRAVTHLDVSDEDIDGAIGRIPRALAVTAHV